MLPSEVELDREECLPGKGGLKSFVELAWHLVEPADFLDNWHIDEVARHLEAVTRGDIRNLIVNVPPGAMKSLLVCVFWPAWVWTFAPQKKWIFASYSVSLAHRDAVRMRDLVDSDWYIERWGKLQKQATWSAGQFVNRAGGFRLSTSVGGSVTGFHADVQVVDDPIKPLDTTGGAEATRTALSACLEWWSGTMASRLADPKTSARLIVMQRLHEADLAGEMIKTGHYEHLRLPMEYEAAEPSRTSIGGDQRRDEGELLWPARFDAGSVAKLKREMGVRTSAAQLAQRPSPAAGAVFKREWFGNRWRELPSGLRLIQSWDAAFKSTATSDWVVGHIWGQKGANYYLIDSVKDRMSFSATCDAIRGMSAKWPRAFGKIVEDKANGPAIADTLQNEIPGIILVNPEGGKEARANAIAPLLEAGNVFLPQDATHPWVSDFIEECIKFPVGLHDDQVDAMTQALLWLHLKSPRRYTDAMKAVSG